MSSGEAPYYDSRGRPRWSRQHRWTEAEDEQIRQAYALGDKTSAIAATLGVSVGALLLRAQRHLNLHRPAVKRATNAELLDRFMKKVAIGRLDDGDCWRWIGASWPTGYGSFWLGNRLSPAHRAAYILLIGPIPADLYVCHSCDRPWCVNPAHLFVGTQGDNIQDCMSKGRFSAPPRTNWRERTKPHHWQKLSAEEVKTIKRRLAGGDRPAHIARDFQVQPEAISKIKRGQRWAYVEG